MAPGRGGHDGYGGTGSNGRRRPLSSKGSLDSGGHRFDYDDDGEHRQHDDECSRSSTDQEYDDDPELERSPSERELDARKNGGPMTPAEMRAARLASARRLDRQRATAPWYIKRQRSLIIGTFICLSLCLVGLSVGLAVYFVNKGNNNSQGGVTDEIASGTGDSSTSSHTGTDENELQRKRKRRSDIESRLVLEGITSSSDLTTPGSPQNASLEWIAHHDPLALNPFAETETWTHLIQRYVLGVLYFSLVPGAIELLSEVSISVGDNMQNSNETTPAGGKNVFNPPTTNSGLDSWLSSSTECEWDYVTCEEFLVRVSITDERRPSDEFSLSIDGEKMQLPPVGVNGEFTQSNSEEDPMSDMAQKVASGPDNRHLKRNGNVQRLSIPSSSTPLLRVGKTSATSKRSRFVFSQRFVKEVETEGNAQHDAAASNHEEQSESLAEEGNQALVPVITTLSLGDVRAATIETSPDVDDFSDLLFGENSTMPSELGILTFLQGLNLSNLHWTGTLPKRLGDLVNITGFVVSECPFISGPLPDSFSNLSNLQVLNVEGNNLNGTVPQYLEDLSELRHIKLANNSFSGELTPDLFFRNKANLEWITLAYNDLEGDISPSICDLPSSVMVDVRDGIITQNLDSLPTTALEGAVEEGSQVSSVEPILPDDVTCTCCNL